MNKKRASLLLAVVLLITSVFAFCGCTEEEKQEIINQTAEAIKNEINNYLSENSTASNSTAAETPEQNITENNTSSEQNSTQQTAEKPEQNQGNKKSDKDYVEYKFRNSNLLSQHYDKHGKDMGFANKKDYEKAASDVINNPEALSKTEKEDGDMCFYIEATNEFVVLSKDGYIRTYFLPDAGKKYFDKQ